MFTTKWSRQFPDLPLQFYYGTTRDWNQTLMTTINRCMNDVNLQNFISIKIKLHGRLYARIAPVLSCSFDMQHVVESLFFYNEVTKQVRNIDVSFTFGKTNTIEFVYGDKILALIEVV